MSIRLPARFPYFLSPLTLLLGSFVWHASTLFSPSLPLATQPDFHVQLSYLCLTSDWESFFSHTCFTLNPKSNSSALLRTASSNSD